VESFRTADGRVLSYRREGAGPLLVCHPGGPGFSARYFGDLAGLGAHFTLAMLNPRGSEGSDRPSDHRAYETSDYVSDLDELRAHLGLEQMLLLGHSHGGVVAAAYAAAHPARVKRLVLASTLARFAAEQQAAMQADMDAKAGEPWYEDAKAALDDEQEGRFETDEELAALALREFPFYFARYDEAGEA
jgi:pimeloyl-ACP methyl ester carboxylesterase